MRYPFVFALMTGTIAFHHAQELRLSMKVTRGQKPLSFLPTKIIRLCLSKFFEPEPHLAIAFARCTHLQRSRGHSTIQRLAYLGRTRLLLVRTGETFDFSERDDLLSLHTLVPEGCDLTWQHGETLWSGVEAASKRKDAALGFELLLALPMPSEFPPEASRAMAEAFVRQIIVDKHLLPATLAIHAPHGSDVPPLDIFETGNLEDPFATAMATSSVNMHCHVIVAPRQLTAEGLARRRYTALDPVNRGKKVYGRDWGRLWHHFQNQYFAKTGTSLRVTPNPPISQTVVPLTAVRRWRKGLRRSQPLTDGRALLVNAERERENADMLLLFDGILDCFDAPFTKPELEALLLRHQPREVALELVDAVLGASGCIELSAPSDTRAWYGTPRLVHNELSALGRARILATRNLRSANVEASVQTGFSEAAATFLTELFAGPDITIGLVPTGADFIAIDIALVAQAAGMPPITVSTAAGHVPPRSVLVDIAELSKKRVTQATVIVDDVDALTASELNAILGMAIIGANKLVLLRHVDSDWPPLELIDLLSHHVPTLTVSAQPGARPSTSKAVRPQLVRTAITTPLADSASPKPVIGQPAFALDHFGKVTTSPAAIAQTAAFLASNFDAFEWEPATENIGLTPPGSAPNQPNALIDLGDEEWGRDEPDPAAEEFWALDFADREDPSDTFEDDDSPGPEQWEDSPQSEEEDMIEDHLEDEPDWEAEEPDTEKDF